MKNIILLHGAIGAKDQLEPLAVELKQRGYNVYTLSFSGHGNTPFQNNFGIEQFASELEQFIKENKSKQPHIFGYSMGGFVALYLAKHKPSLIGNIITLGTKFEWSPEISQKEIRMLDPKTIIEKVPKFVEALKARHGEDWEGLLRITSDMMIALGDKDCLTLEDFSAIENKILIGLADKDTMVSLKETVDVYSKLKNGSMYMLPNTKHPIETVNTHLLAEIIENFI